MENRRLLRITTVAISLHLLVRGQFRFMREHGFEVLTASADGPEVKEVKHEGVDHAVIFFTRRITPFRDLICVWQLVRLIRKFRPAIVHTHTPKAGLLGLMAAWLCRVPVRLHTVAGLPFMESKGLKNRVLRLCEKITYACAHRVYPNSLVLKSYLQKELNIVPGKLKVLGLGSSNGIDTSFFSRSEELLREARGIRDRHKIAPGEMTFCFVGRIVRDKGVSELAEAFDRLGKDRPVRLLLVGPFEESLDPLPDSTMRFLRNDPRVVLPGFQKDVRPWLLASDVFVFPSYREGFPNVVMQACCLEVPGIVSDINGCNEIIRDGLTGLLVKPKDIDRLYKAMLELSGDPAKRREFGQRSREFVSSNFDQPHFWDLLLNEYQTLLKK